MECIPINLGGHGQLFSEFKATEFSSRIMFSHFCLTNNDQGRIESLKYRILLYFPPCRDITPLQWRHNECDGVSNHQPHDCLLNRLFRRRSKKTSKLRVTGLGEGNSPVTGEFPAQRVSNAENVSIWWRHHVLVNGRPPVPIRREFDWCSLDFSHKWSNKELWCFLCC